MSASRLASLLVQDNLVTAKKMAQAFQRQVIYGGTLDTILLEMDAVDEATLVEAMGRASSLPTAGDLPSKEQLDAAGAKDWFPHALCERFRAVPVALDGNVLRVLVTDPPDRKQLDELGYMLSRSIDPIVVPEHRFVHAVEMVYGVAVPARFASLTAKVRQRASEAQSRPARVVQMVAEPADAIPDKRVSLRELAQVMSTPERRQPEYTATPTSQTVRMPAVQLPPEVQRTVVTDVPMPPRQPSAPAAEQPETPTPRVQPVQGASPQAVSPEVTLPHSDTLQTMTTPIPLPLDVAAQRMDEAGDRDAIFEALCRGARSQLDFVALLMVHGEVAVGRMALADMWLPRDVLGQISVPLEKASAFRAAVTGKAPYLGRLGEDSLSAQALTALGRKPPTPALLLPIVLRERTVALLYGDADGKPVDAKLLAGLSTTVVAAARSFQRLILKQKTADYAKAPTQPKAGKVSAAATTGEASQGGSWHKAAEAPAQATEAKAAAGGTPESVPDGKARLTSRGFAALSNALAHEAANAPADGGIHDAPTQAVPAGPAMTDTEALVQSVVREDEHARASGDALVTLGERGAQAVVAHLPGPLRLDRHTLRGPIPPLAEHGPLLTVLARLGQAALGSLLARMNDSSLEVRYYATLAAGELKLPAVISSLAQRLLDPDAGVRHVAIQALAQFPPSPELRTLTESLRGELPGPEAIRQRYASEALGVLRDVPSVPRLIELVKHPDSAVVTAARRALIDITKQDFGTSRWRWRGWWDRHRHEPRVEWMLEGLGHAEAEVRMSASEELRGMSTEYFGYHFDLPKREREEARRKWVDWWRQHGSKQQQDKRT
jgi:hypothetical protein